ncbi:MAG: ACP S-malonyltransferase [Pseudomonadales bacterium]|nr:ACP S-malonyltransferase [Pseudomonadales bacterium]
MSAGKTGTTDHTPINNHLTSMNKPSFLFLFPGQGAQYSSMGSDLHAEHEIVRHTYEEAVDVLGYDITHLSFADPDGKINLTRYTQPAILTHSVACLRLFSELTEGQLSPDVTAGHSLGEYTALVAANVLDFASALRLVSTRGELMGAHGDGEMEALPLDVEAAAKWAEKHYCAIAAGNLPEKIVGGGHA